MVIDYILPFLKEIPSRDPAVVMGIIGIYRLAVNHRKLGVTKEIISTRILPFVFPLCIENGLTTQQFSTIMNFVYEMIKTVETEHKAKLEELGAIAKEREQMKEEMNSHPVFQTESNLSSPSDIFDGFSAPISPVKSLSMSTAATSSFTPLQAQSSISRPPAANNFDTGGMGVLTSVNSKPRSYLMSSLINSNLTQMKSCPTSNMPMSMSSSTSMPLGLTSSNDIRVPNGGGVSSPTSLMRSPTLGLMPVSTPTPPPPSTSTMMMNNSMQQQQRPMQFGVSGFQQVRPGFINPPPSFPLPTNPSASHPPFGGGIMQPIIPASSTSTSNAGPNSVKGLSKRDIDDLLS